MDRIPAAIEHTIRRPAPWSAETCQCDAHASGAITGLSRGQARGRLLRRRQPARWPANGWVARPRSAHAPSAGLASPAGAGSGVGSAVAGASAAAAGCAAALSAALGGAVAGAVSRSRYLRSLSRSWACIRAMLATRSLVCMTSVSTRLSFLRDAFSLSAYCASCGVLISWVLVISVKQYQQLIKHR